MRSPRLAARWLTRTVKELVRALNPDPFSPVYATAPMAPAPSYVPVHRLGEWLGAPERYETTIRDLSEGRPCRVEVTDCDHATRLLILAVPENTPSPYMPSRPCCPPRSGAHGVAA
ncbi:hypothetical protein [Streptomyces sp. NRRL F-5126]|uniref:hypothetical protein n=1 Tax=Streptomyces sp. NRRL F-5126 TaxID=1463857 RepID=UPI00068C1EEA|nr:hypothetical protein [Streptomyces sp. NRRL F-5126]